MLLLQLLGVGIELKAGFRGGFENDFSCLLTDMGLIIQYPGNGADAISDRKSVV